MEKETGTGKCGSMMLPFVLGAAAGAGLALLMTPKAGHEVRGKIKDLSKDAMAKSKEYAQGMQEKAKAMMEKGKSSVEQGTEAVTEQAREASAHLSAGAKETMEQPKPHHS